MIRKFEKNDINAVMEIWVNENIRTHNFIAKEYWKDNYEYVKDILPKADIYVYILDEQVVGFVGANNNYVEGIFVDINNQHSGIGTSLLDRIKENKDNLTLNVYKKNANAIKFYKKNNFIITSENIDKDTNEIEYTMTWSKQQITILIIKKKEIMYYEKRKIFNNL